MVDRYLHPPKDRVRNADSITLHLKREKAKLDSKIKSLDPNHPDYEKIKKELLLNYKVFQIALLRGNLVIHKNLADHSS